MDTARRFAGHWRLPLAADQLDRTLCRPETDSFGRAFGFARGRPARRGAGAGRPGHCVGREAAVVGSGGCPDHSRLAATRWAAARHRRRAAPSWPCVGTTGVERKHGPSGGARHHDRRQTRCVLSRSQHRTGGRSYCAACGRGFTHSRGPAHPQWRSARHDRGLWRPSLSRRRAVYGFVTSFGQQRGVVTAARRHGSQPQRQHLDGRPAQAPHAQRRPVRASRQPRVRSPRCAQRA